MGEWIKIAGIMAETYKMTRDSNLVINDIGNGDYEVILYTNTIGNHSTIVEAKSMSQAKVFAISWARNLLTKFVYETEKIYNRLPSLSLREYQEEKK